MSGGLPRTFKLERQTLEELHTLSQQAGCSQSAIFEAAWAQLRAYGLERIDWAALTKPRG